VNTYIEINKSDTAGKPLETAASRKLQVAALLTEAIQLYRGLASQFPDNPDYKSRLTALEKLQAQHFGKMPEVGTADGSNIKASEKP
jgi:hypothetical protein